MPRTEATPTRSTRRQEPDLELDLELLDAYRRAANRLPAGQIHPPDDPLLHQPLRAEHVKPRLLGHRETAPRLNLLYAHMNDIAAIQHDAHDGTSPPASPRARGG